MAFLYCLKWIYGISYKDMIYKTNINTVIDRIIIVIFASILALKP